jgi:hypothetical protein
VLIYRSARVNTDIKILATLITILLLVFFTWLLIRQTKTKRRKKITEVIVDSKGFHHYSNKELASTIGYDDLETGPPTTPFDVFLHDTPETAPTLCVYVLDKQSAMPARKGVFIESDVVITNGKTLLSHFVKGIIVFRPDLRIQPGVLDFYGLFPDQVKGEYNSF